MRRRFAVLALVVVTCGASALCLREASRLSGQQPSQAPTFKAASTQSASAVVLNSDDGARAAQARAALGAMTQPPTYLLLIDTESFDEDQARKACATAGAFVDGLDPDDRVAILSVASGTGGVEASRDRLAAGASLVSIVGTAAARPAGRRGSPLTLSEAISIASGDYTTIINRVMGADA